MSLASLIKQLKKESRRGEDAFPPTPPPAEAPGLVPVVLTGNVGSGSGGSDAGGYYTGTIKLLPMSDAAGDGGNLALGEGMLDGQSCIVVNMEETGLNTHWLKSGAYQWAHFVHVDTDGTPILALDGGYYRTASPATLVADDGKSFNRNAKTSGDVYGDTALEVYVVCTDSSGQNPATRKMTQDAGGRIALWGEEVADLTSVPSDPTVTPPASGVVGDTIFVWDNVTVIFPGTTTTGDGSPGDPYVVATTGGAEWIDELVKITQDGEVTIYSGDARGRKIWMSVHETDENAPPEDSEWGQVGGLASFRFGTAYDEVGAGTGEGFVFYAGATGSGNVEVFLDKDNGQIKVKGWNAGGTWAEDGYYHVRAAIGPVRLSSAPTKTI